MAYHVVAVNEEREISDHVLMSFLCFMRCVVAGRGVVAEEEVCSAILWIQYLHHTSPSMIDVISEFASQYMISRIQSIEQN